MNLKAMETRNLVDLDTTKQLGKQFALVPFERKFLPTLISHYQRTELDEFRKV